VTTSESTAADPGWTPMFAQYFGLRETRPEAILLMRVGDFYEAYGEDAETIARLLQIALTAKEAGGGRRVAMAGVPHHALDGYLAKLVGLRRVVALADQLEPPVPNRLTKRGIVRVVTPGTLLEDHLIERGANNYLAAVAGAGGARALVHVDLSTGRAAATAFAGDRAEAELLAEIARLGPAEIVADTGTQLVEAIARIVPESRICAPPPADPSAPPASATPGADPDGFSLDEARAMRAALAVLSAFARSVGIAREESFARTPEPYRAHGFLALDAATRRHLDLLRAQGANAKATLLATIDRARTGMGSRALARWIAAPLLDEAAIGARADAVQTLLGDYSRRTELQALLGGAFDLERIAQKVRFRRALPRDLASLRRTLALFAPLRAAIPAALAALSERLADPGDLLSLLTRTLVDDPPATLADGGVIAPSASGEIAACVELRTHARDRIAALEDRERARTGIKSLKVKYAANSGYAIEIGRAHLHGVPTEYVRTATLAAAERFVTSELRELESAIAGARTRQLRLEEARFAALVDEVGAHVDALLACANAIAELDAYASLAEIAADRGYVRPTFSAASEIEIRDGRHPVAECLVGAGRFVPNDLRLDEDRARFMVLTGPNMGGKSTYLRQSALLVILAQIGSFVPARAMRLGIVDRIFTRIGAGDDLASGQSTFFVEMAEAATILRSCTARSLLLVDEIGRGTSTVDGLALAQAICEYLIGLEPRGPLTLFATHFHELVALAERRERVVNYHVTAVAETADSGAPVFSHRILPGSTSRSFGIEVARMAGLPEAVVARAREVAAALDERPLLEPRVPLRRRASSDGEELQLALRLH